MNLAFRTLQDGLVLIKIGDNLTIHPAKGRAMLDIQIIRTPNGDELVVLPRAAYDALIARLDESADDDDDVAIYDARKAELARDAAPLMGDRT